MFRDFLNSMVVDFPSSVTKYHKRIEIRYSDDYDMEEEVDITIYGPSAARDNVFIFSNPFNDFTGSSYCVKYYLENINEKKFTIPTTELSIEKIMEFVEQVDYRVTLVTVAVADKRDFPEPYWKVFEVKKGLHVCNN